MRTSVSALAELMVRIHSPPAVSPRTFGSGGELPPRDDIVLDAFLGQATVSKRQPTGGGLRVRIQFPPAESPRLARFSPPTTRSRLFARVWARQVPRGQQRRVSRGAWRRPAGISLSGQIPVPRRRCGGGLMNSDRAQVKPSTDRCSYQASGRRECASSLSAVKSRG